MANDNDFKGGSPWGSPPGGGNGSGRGRQQPPNIDEIIQKIQICEWKMVKLTKVCVMQLNKVPK